MRFPIADAHQHFWNPRAHYLPWLCDAEPIAFRYGDYSALKRPYLPEDYFADARGFEVLAACPNAAIKISGIGVPGARWSSARCSTTMRCASMPWSEG